MTRLPVLLVFAIAVGTHVPLMAQLQIIPPGPPFVFAPYPVKPFAARNVTGTGRFLLRIDIKKGDVKQVVVRQCTGDPRLDEASVKALSRWRVKSGALHHEEASIRISPPLAADEALVEIPITFSNERGPSHPLHPTCSE
jgi:Gram-negative bacterial TonB protein C-terminal